MLKKLGIPMVLLCALLLLAPQAAIARVHMRVYAGVGPSYTYTVPYGYSYAYPSYYNTAPYYYYGPSSPYYYVYPRHEWSRYEWSRHEWREHEWREHHHYRR